MPSHTDEPSALMDAAAAGDHASVTQLLAAGADPRETRMNRFTALHAAAMHGHADILELLLSAGADPNSQTEPQKYAPLHSAAFAGHDEAIRVLLAHGARADLRNHRGETPAETAGRNNHTRTVALLVGDEAPE